jgi:hypothetical protein
MSDFILRDNSQSKCDLMLSKNLFVKTKSFVCDIPEICANIPMYGLISTDAHGTLGIRIMLSNHKGIGPALQVLAKAFGRESNPMTITDNEFCCLGVITRPTSKIELMNNLECVIRMDKYRAIADEMMKLGTQLCII